jgi:hypothetical protein
MTSDGGRKVRRVEDKRLRRLKAAKSFLHENSNALHDWRHFAAFSVDSVHSKKPSGGPKGLIGPPCHGAPWPPEAKERKQEGNHAENDVRW